MDRRTSLISAAAIAAVLLAGGTAVAANIGVLGAAGEDSIGQLSASGESGSTVGPTSSTSTSTSTVAPTESNVATVAPDASTDTQGFQVEDAGTVTVRRVGTGIELGEVVPSVGWTWSLATTSPSELTVTFTSPDTVYVFIAQSGVDGAISARVDHVIVQPSPEVARPAPATSTVSLDGDDGPEHDDDDDHDDGSDDDHAEQEEHEGGEDDD